jgi:two-component system NarL family sensor kinase
MMYPLSSQLPSPVLPWSARELRAGVRTIAVQRAVAVPVLAVAGFTLDGIRVVPFAVLVAVAFVAELAQLAVLFSERRAELPLPFLLFVDVGMLAVAIALTDGAQSPVALIALLSIFPATYAFGPRYMAALCAWVVLSCGGVVLVDGLADDDPGAVVAFAAALVLMSVICVKASSVREAASRDLHALAAARRRLVADAAGAEASDRRRISQQLHDFALQTLLAARQDLDDVADGDPAALLYARVALQTSVETVRDLVYDIDPAALAGTRLPEALQGLVDRSAAEDDVAIDATIAGDATGTHDVLLHAVARLLLRSATRQSGARNLTLQLRRDADVVELEVCDDGRRLSFEEHEEGTIGIASAAARVDAAGGTLTVQRRRAQGTRVVVRLPNGPAPGR